ncbi:MAG: methyltransferase domain-containing protein [Bacteroidetes bacterium]|nr:MAG: methyltransferase domain-containing protein [Bacteroidota bacterium]REK07553.1 MAG: methyltransferase domain-containing protein [Bacteroidota bacterium]REK37014.1 MAG: methyltransferase domain-containing protein [Bacteroidota bacterium]REK47835.1 MAG: methyltransferase domain-containing protein [Bacteroidota bacterium]
MEENIKPAKEITCCVSQCDVPLDKDYWEKQWKQNQTGWDIGYASPPLTEYMNSYSDKDASILIPGCGNAYEAEALANAGFTDITLIDIAPSAVEILQKKFEAISSVKVLCEDFFRHEGEYDLILEQTFFCAIPPSRRMEYAEKSASLLKNDGIVAGVLFDRTFEQEGPPFGGCPCEYKPVLEPHFHISKMEECRNSIPQRAGSEVFIELIKKNRLD